MQPPRSNTDHGLTACRLPGAEVPTAATWGIAPFFVERRPGADGAGGARFDFGAPTTGRNALRVLRALQVGALHSPCLGSILLLPASAAHWRGGPPAITTCLLPVLPPPCLQLRKPILLEGSPGVGKTSLVAAMAKAVGEPAWGGGGGRPSCCCCCCTEQCAAAAWPDHAQLQLFGL